jgi:adenosylmethionine-8-amino-7-oxononanoate aminotransferase
MVDTSKETSAILSRVSWKLPVATKAEGIYIDLQDGRRLIDAVGMITSSIVSTMFQIFEL